VERAPAISFAYRNPLRPILAKSIVEDAAKDYAANDYVSEEQNRRKTGQGTPPASGFVARLGILRIDSAYKGGGMKLFLVLVLCTLAANEPTAREYYEELKASGNSQS
jgi:hypothetical protein